MKKKRRSIHKALAGQQRDSKKKEGFFDGRFVSRAQESKKKYSRKTKHKLSTKNQNCEN